MKRGRILGLLGLAVLAIVAFIYLGRFSTTDLDRGSGETNTASATAAPSGGLTLGVPRLEVEEVLASPEFAQAYAQQSNMLAEMGIPPGGDREEMEAKISEWAQTQRDTIAKDWQRSIDFYGKVLDQDDQPVEGVQVHLIWTDTSASGSSEMDVLTDSRGQFSFTGQTGRLLQVWLKKDGYYVPKTNRVNFDYRDGYMAELNDPALFRVIKKGPGVDLITSQYGVSPDFKVAVPKDGTTIRVNMLQRTAGSSGQMEIWSWIKKDPDTHRTTSWQLRLSIPDGGFIAHQDEFPFMAPETGYQTQLVFPEESGSGSRFGLSRRKYYIAFGQPRRYGRLELSASASTGNVMLRYAINPDGSRYLEPK